MAYQWPLRDFLEYGALPSAVPSARLHARQIAWEWGLSALGENVELLVSELMTNGIAAARAIEPISPVRLWLLADTTRILILVWDASPYPPTPAHADEYAESGRGLLLVQALSQRWGSYPTPQMGGKAVWALCCANTSHANTERHRGARRFGAWAARRFRTLPLMPTGQQAALDPYMALVVGYRKSGLSLNHIIAARWTADTASGQTTPTGDPVRAMGLGGAPGARTQNPRIKSPLLYH
jgi:anti-sigma regulatory factor (Ser/Thr protein kinase)